MFFDRCYFCISMLAALLRALFFAFQCLQRYCEHCFLHFGVCSITASTVFCVLSLAALLRALFFAFWRLQRHCEHCFLRFGACSVTANIVFCVLSLAALLRALFFAFYRLQRYCEHCFLHFIACSVTASIVFCVLSSPRGAGIIFLHFIVCSVTASIKIFVFTFAERRCVFGMVGAVPVCPPERPRSGVSIRKIYLRITYHTRGFNDGCALAGRAGRHTGTATTLALISFPIVHSSF